MKSALIIFVKNAVLGRVKTRLAATVGDAMALNIYEQLLAHTRAVCEQSGVDCLLFYSEQVELNDAWNGERFEKFVQVEGDLGQRMSAAFEVAFGLGYERVAIIGSDCGDLQVRHLKRAFEVLNMVDFVLGPSNDGGYYLLGMRAFEPFVFESKSWSTPSVLADTLKDIRLHQRSVSLLEELIDVDTEEDWRNSGVFAP